jgi:flagellar hook-basal body complex protein FliE
VSIAAIGSVHGLGAISASQVAGHDKAQGIAGVAGIGEGTQHVSTDHTDVGGTFSDALSQARALDQDAASQSEKFANNDPSVGIHEVMIASEKANIALRYATTIKNKALEAYHELMQTQV